MTTIVSRRHIFKFYLSILLGVLFFLGMSIVMIALFIKNSNHGTLKPKEYMMPIFGVAVLLMAFYTVYRYYKNAPKIVLEGNLISFNSETFSLSDVQKVVLTGKHNFPYNELSYGSCSIILQGWKHKVDI